MRGKDGPKEKTFTAKSPYTGHGLKDATTDEAVILGWWKKWPNAMIGLPMGVNGLFALDFDPRVDESTGEVFTLESLKAALEEQMGCALPVSLAAMTQSDGVHVFLRQPREGEPIRNRGNLPRHVDVRGLGGYVIAPASVMNPDGKGGGTRYRWLRGNVHDEPAEAPAQLIEILRAPKSRAAPAGGAPAGAQAPATGDAGGGTPPASSPSPRFSSADPSAPVGGDAASFHASASDAEQAAIDEAVRRYAYAALDGEVRNAAGAGDGTRNDTISIAALTLGHLVGAKALSRAAVIGALAEVAASWPNYDKTMRSIETGVDKGAEEPRDLTRVIEDARARFRRRAARPGPRGGVGKNQPFHPEGSGQGQAEAGAGVPAPANDDDSDGVAAAEANRRLAFFPLTDLGNAERFRERYGRDFRWSSALGWMTWDGRRWAALDQDEKMIPAELLGRVFDMARAIQDEAGFIRDSGVPFPPPWREEGKPPRAWVQQQELAESTGDEDGERLDRVVKIKSDGTVVLFSDKLAEWGRTSEGASKLTCIANLVRPWLAAKADAFDADPLSINVLNGTLRFRRTWIAAEKRWQAEWRLDPHNRDDLISKLAPVAFDRDAACPIYDDMFAWAQPDAAMRRYLHQWGGLSMTGHMGEQKLHFWYGLGGNGKSTAIDAWCAALGDYTTTIGIETFLDQGIKKRGDQATPDLARLGGVRLLRTSEPEKGGKLATALIKLVTGGEPMTVRFLNRGFFDLRPIFKLTISGNFRPEIPDTDDGIWRRVKLIPWNQRVRDETNPEGTREKDPELPNKLLGELPGILNKLIAGLLDWMENGLVEPGEVTRATQAYRQDSDPLGRFLRLCTKADPQARVQSSRLHAVFVAWCKAAGEREWSNKGLAKAMQDKGYEKKASDGMQWLGIELVRDVGDFIDAEGNPRPFSIDEDGGSPPAQAPPSGSPWDEVDDLPP